MRYTLWFCLIMSCSGRASAQSVAKSADQPAADGGGASQAPAASEQVTQERAIIRHTPLNEVLASDARLSFEVNAPDRAGLIVVHVRPRRRELQAFEVSAARDGVSGYTVQLPAASVVPPGFEYWVVERMPDGEERAVFATADRSHRVRVSRTDEDEAEYRRLTRRAGQRSALIMAAEGVDYGDRRLAAGSPRQHDRYYRFEVGYAYSFLTRVEDVRLTLVRARGQAGLYEASPEPSSVAARPGIDYGRAAVTMLANDFVRLRGSLLFGASQRGFAYGGGGALVLGDPRDMNLDLGVESIKTLGTTAHLRLGFLASARIPMGASIEVSTFPVGDDPGVRLLYDVGYYFGPVTELRLRGGYQGRTSISGGPSLGLDLCYGF